MRICRRERAATSSSCVTTISVMPPRVERLERGQHLGARDVVEVAGGLVGEQHRRPHHHGACDGDALALAARQLVRAVVARGRVRLSAASTSSTRARRSAGAIAREHHRQLDVLERGEARHEVERLEDEADARARTSASASSSSAVVSRPSSR